MSARRARLAVVGLGRIGRLHAVNLSGRVPSAELVAVVDPREAAARAAAEALGVPWATSLPQLLSDTAPDGVVIAAPTGRHAELMELAATSGRHVFCEKPLGLDPVDCRRAVEVTEAAGVELQVGFQRRFDPGWRALAEALEAGDLGRLALLRSSHRNAAVPANRDELGDLLVDLAIHDLDSARWLAGEVVQVFARTAAPPHDAAAITLRFASGALGLIDVNGSAGYGFDSAAELVGDRATARLGYAHASLELLDAGGAQSSIPRTHADRHAEAYVHQLDYFGELVMGRRTPRATGRDALAAHELVHAARRSEREGAPVAVVDPVAVSGAT